MSSQSILIVDDEPDMRDALKRILLQAMNTLTVIEAVDGKDALEKASRQKFDLVITDVTMPRMDGMALVRELKKLEYNFRPTGIVVISGNAHEPTSTAGSGVIFLPKPFKDDMLIGAVAKLLDWVQVDQKKPKTKVDAEFIAPFVEGAVQVIKTLAGTEIKRDSLGIRTDSQPSGDVSALIAMNSNDYLGSMAISFEEKCFLAIVGRMFGETYTSVTAEIQDAAAEICNQIFGYAKAKLNEKGHTIQRAIPSVVTGKSHTLRHSASGPCITVKFTSEVGNFTIEAVMQAR